MTIMLALFAAAALQQHPVVASDSGARMLQLADGVFAIVHDAATTDWETGAINWPHSNVGVIVGDNGVLVVDTDYFPSRARADIALIRRVTRLPVRYVVNTHWHGDHTHGNAVYRDSFPDVVIVGARDNRHWISLNLARWPAVATRQDSPTRAALAGMLRLQAAGRDSAGRELSAEQRARLPLAIEQQRTELLELAAVREAAPDSLFDRELTIRLGRREVRLVNQDRANSPADVTVYLPRERVLFTGDILVHPVPYAWASHPRPWIGVLRRLEALPVSALVPGHGPVMRDHAYTAQVRELFEATAQRVEAAMRRGRTLAEIQAEVTMADFRPRFMIAGDPNPDAIWEGSIPALVERMHQCVQGYRC